jgi:DNA-binding transcriptional regulator YiaG
MMEQREKKKRQWTKDEVRALRQHLNLTQATLADELGTRQQTISEWENGMYRPRGASATLLSIVAERSGFTYKPENKHDESTR